MVFFLDGWLGVVPHFSLNEIQVHNYIQSKFDHIHGGALNCLLKDTGNVNKFTL